MMKLLGIFIFVALLTLAKAKVKDQAFVPYSDQTVHTPVAPQTPNPYVINLDLSNVLSGLLPKFPKTPTAADSKIVSRPINQGQRPINQGQRPQNLEPLVVMDLCYFVGKDIYNSHLTPETFDWFDYSLESYKQYLNLLTFETNKIMNRVDYNGQERNNDFQLRWLGPFERSDFDSRYPDNARQDTQKYGGNCDVSVFLIFNDFSNVDATDGHDISGYAEGAPCEAHLGSGFTAVVDQGFYNEYWMGPQVLAHHLFLLLTSDLYISNPAIPNQSLEPRNCPNVESILHADIYPGQQFRDQCLNDKLQRSKNPLRECLRYRGQ